jgi:16S rRNA (guanine1207-N2)-methyltransferase
MNHAAATVLLDCVSFSTGRVLVIGDGLGLVSVPLAERGCTVETWQRMTSAYGVGSAWPECSPVDAVALRLPKDKTAFEMALHAASGRLKVGGKLWVYGANDEGIKSATKRVSALFGPVEILVSRKHCRVLEATRPTEVEGLLPALSDWKTHTDLGFSGGVISQTSYPGVFAKGLLDDGTRLLLDALPKLEPATRVLDYASGSGVIGMGLLQATPTLSLTLIDADAICIEAAKANLPHATCHIGASLSALPESEPFDIIVANPPYHDGKARSMSVIQTLIRDAPGRLADGAALWLVVQRQVNVSACLAEHLDTPECVAENRRFRVWRASKIDIRKQKRR